MATKELTDMHEFLGRFKAVASALMASAEQYSSALKDTKQHKIKIAVGKHYRTYNNSLVMVVDEKTTECDCPRCQARRNIGESVKKMFGANIQTNYQDTAEDTEPVYLVVVLEGGHGIEDTIGDAPGEKYEVDKHGIFRGVSEQLTGDSKQDVLSSRLLSVAGMSLHTECQMTLKEKQ